jgi:D-threo-aldose 1-dehydrogenase
MQLKTRAWNRHGTPLSFTELGLGTAPLANLYRAISDDQAHAVLQQAWDGGVRHFDTAPLYGLGLAETRLNRFLRDKPRDAYVLASKVGRLLRPCPPDQRSGIGKWFDVPNRTDVYDYAHDGVLRSVEFSLERLGVDRIDVLHVHDLDIFTHKRMDVLDGYRTTFMAGGYKALIRLRDEGVIAAIGAGLNESEQAQWLLERGDFDLFLLAGRYTLLEQGALDGFLPLCMERGARIILGGPYNSGVLATGAVPGAFYNYDPAPDPVLDRVRRIETVCAAHKVRLVDAAFQFCLRHPAVLTVIPGGQSVDQMAGNLAAARAMVPEALWSDLKAQGLLRDDAP